MIKWRAERNQRPRDLQVDTPRTVEAAVPLTSMSNDQRSDFNERALSIYRQHSMVQCRDCGRRFDSVDKMQKHHQGCEKRVSRSLSPGMSFSFRSDDEGLTDDGEVSRRSSFTRSPGRSPGRGGRAPGSPQQQPFSPRMFACCYCGREYSSASLKLHIDKVMGNA